LTCRLQFSRENMMRVEIRWLDSTDKKRDTEFSSYIKALKDTDTSTVIEETFQAWLGSRIAGNRIVVSDLEIYVNGELVHFPREEENRFYQRLKDAAGK